jgi:2-haloalkanoic acid dehalogenase type II
MTTLELDRIRALTFDCYGTLIDWLGGVRRAVAAMPSLEGCDVGRLLKDRENVELEMLSGPYRPYRDVLAISMARAARMQEREPSPDEIVAFSGSMGTWEPFAETPVALQHLREHYRLAILSNVDDAVLDETLARLDVPIDVRVTAEDVRSYKPAAAHFEEALKRLELDKTEVLHVAQSVRHDLRPAAALGWRTAWVNRLSEKAPLDVKPTVVVPDLQGLVELLADH